ncbi:MAG: MFS transporter [Tetragenococcus koreensis]|nr:MFS transporter [Tetragenococcus koreensis]
MEDHSNYLTKQFIFLLAATCGIVVANMYYIQPIGTQVAESFQVSTSAIGSVTMLTQLGYALGLLLIVPLGDILNKRRLIITMAALSSLSLLGAFFAPNFQLFIFSAFIIGLLSVVPQIIIPYGAVLAGPEKRGQVMGKLLSGLLVGILLSRTFSGIIASILPWRSVYLIAPIAIILLTILLTIKMPKDTTANTKLSYSASLKSIPLLVKSQKVLREAAVSGFFMFGTFSIFWSTLIFYISSPVYNWGTFAAGVLAVFGLSGALAAPIVGKLSDQYAQRTIVWIGLLMQTSSFIILHFFAAHIFPLVLSIVLLDVGNQFGQVANQTRVQNLGEQVSNRNNTVFMFSYFIGGAVGSFLGTTMWEAAGWTGVTLIALLFQALAIIFHLFVFRKQD